MSNYVNELRRLIGNRPLILAGASVLIFDAHRRLLLQLRTDNLQWGIPGGSMEPGEYFEETARREVQEECGLTIGKLHLLDVFSGPDQFYQFPNGDQVYNACAVYVTGQAEGKLQLDENEGVELRYFPLEALPSNISPPDLPVLDRLKAAATSGLLDKWLCPDEKEG